MSLRVSEAQRELIATNSASLSWADQNQRCVPKGIYAEQKMIGFAMYEPRGSQVFSIHRFMIDKGSQGNGYGYRAMRFVMDEIAATGGVTIYLSFRPENNAAKRLFFKLEYVFQIAEPDGEIVYRHGTELALGA